MRLPKRSGRSQPRPYSTLTRLFRRPAPPPPPDPGPSPLDLFAYYEAAAVEFDGVPLPHPSLAWPLAQLEAHANHGPAE